MNRYLKTFETWNKVANIYADTFMDLELYNDSYTRFYQALTTPTSTVLEVGCGPGNVAKYILSQRPLLDWFGIDVAPNMIRLAKQYNPKASFKQMDGRNILSLNASYDGIICGFFLPYITPKEANTFVQDCYKLLHINGIFYLSFVDGKPEDSGYITSSQGDQMYFQYHLENELNEHLAQVGFTTLHTLSVNYPKRDGSTEVHTIIIAQKQPN